MAEIDARDEIRGVNKFEQFVNKRIGEVDEGAKNKEVRSFK